MPEKDRSDLQCSSYMQYTNQFVFDTLCVRFWYSAGESCELRATSFEPFARGSQFMAQRFSL
jgi:hypothetical protein